MSIFNTRHLVYPSPTDANIIPNSDALGMLSEGAHDLDRYFFYAGASNGRINNRTSNPFNHTRSVGGYNDGGATIFQNRYLNTVEKGGINPLPPPPSKQYIGNQVSNNPVPLINALVDYPVFPQINQLVDRPLPPQINPIAIN